MKSDILGYPSKIKCSEIALADPADACPQFMAMATSLRNVPAKEAANGKNYNFNYLVRILPIFLYEGLDLPTRHKELRTLSARDPWQEL